MQSLLRKIRLAMIRGESSRRGAASHDDAEARFIGPGALGRSVRAMRVPVVGFQRFVPFRPSASFLRTYAADHLQPRSEPGSALRRNHGVFRDD